MESIAGLPLHPLIVHLAVVLVPVAALVGITVTLWPTARHRLGGFPTVLALCALVIVPVASTSGEALYRALNEPGFVARHASIGDSVILAVVSLFGALALQWLLGRPRVSDLIAAGDRRLLWLRRAVAVAVVAAAVASLVLTIAAGHSGARAVWG
jgi:uncharacterized membrane protein